MRWSTPSVMADTRRRAVPRASPGAASRRCGTWTCPQTWSACRRRRRRPGSCCEAPRAAGRRRPRQGAGRPGQSTLAGWDVHLVSPYRRQVYSGMLPGWVAGTIRRLRDRARPVGSPRRRRVPRDRGDGAGPGTAVPSLCADGSGQHDALSIDTGPMPSLTHLPGAEAHALPIRPIERFIGAWRASSSALRADAAASTWWCWVPVQRASNWPSPSATGPTLKAGHTCSSHWSTVTNGRCRGRLPSRAGGPLRC